MQRTKLSPRFWLALVIFGLTGQVAWVVENMYFNVFLYQMFHASAASISAMVSASAVSATVTTLLVGALSDKVGRRKAFICVGYLLWGLSICGFALLRVDYLAGLFPTLSAAAVGVTLVIILDCVMTFFGSAANDACYNAWLTDSTDSTNRGAAEGVNAMMPLVAILAVFGGFMSFDLTRQSSWTVIFLLIGGVVILIGCLGFFLIEDKAVVMPENRYYFRNIVYGFRPSVMRHNPVLYATLLAFAVFGISIQIFMPYLILYYTEALHMNNYVLVMAPAILLASVATVFYGRLYDKVGFTLSVLPALGLLIAGYVVLYMFRHTAPVFIGSLLMMTGYLAGMAVFGAMLRDHTPENKAGMFQGLRIVAQVLIPGVIGPAVGAFVLRNADTVVNTDGTESFIPNASIFLAALVVAGVACLALVPVVRMKQREVRTNEK